METGKRVIRNAKFLRKAPPPIDTPRQYEAEQWLEQENAPQQVNPPEERNTTSGSEDVPVTPLGEQADQEIEELRCSARNPKPKRGNDYLYY